MSDDVEQIKDRVHVEELVGEYVQLRRAGQHFKGLCPFHQEKTPSFIVSPDKGIWHCFGCGEGGDVFAFVQKTEGVDFRGALQLLATRAGVTLSSQPQRLHQQTGRDRLFDLLALATKFYEQLLQHHPTGEKAREYLASRGVQPQTMTQSHLGYAPDSWDVLQRFLRQRGYQLSEMIAAGVVGKSQAGRTYDRFRGRIIFPIADVQGRVVAFGGRITPWLATGEEGKYINSPETELYRKRQVIYNLDRAKQAIRQHAVGYVVEGYMDVVMLVQSGVPNVVASSGTAFTTEQITNLQRFTTELHFAFDADAAGWKAGVNATHSALAAGMRVAVISFPPGQDPADVAHASTDKLRECLAAPRSLARVVIERLQAASAQEAVTQRDQMFKDIVPLLRTVTHPVQQGEMIHEVAEQLHIPEQRIMNLVFSAPADVTSAAVVQPITSRLALSAEARLGGIFLIDISARQAFFSAVTIELLLDDTILALYKVLQSISHTNPDFFSMSFDDLVRVIPAEHVSLAVALGTAVRDDLTSLGKTGSDEAGLLVRFLKRRFLERQRDQLQQQLAQRGEASAELLQEFQTVLEQLEQVKA